MSAGGEVATLDIEAATAHALLIRSPADFRQTICCAGEAHSALVTPRSGLRRRYRAAIKDIFNDIPKACTQPDRVEAYLTRVDAPLRALHDMGYTIFAVVTNATCHRPGKPDDEIEVVHYLVVGQGDFFHVGREPGWLLHRFDPLCPDAAIELTEALSTDREVGISKTADDAREAHMGHVPWCRHCCLDLVGA